MGVDDPGSRLRPWVPKALRGGVTADQLRDTGRYVVVEEMVLDEVRSIVSDWPGVAEDGQLVFADPEADVEYLDPRTTIEDLLAARRIVRVGSPREESETLEQELKERPVEVGDVYAIVGPFGGRPGPPPGGGSGGGIVRLLDAALEVEIYDISADARLAATATYSASTAGALSAEEAAIYFDEGEENSEGGTPAPTSGGPSDPSGGQSGEHKSLQDEVAAVKAVASEREQAERRVGMSA